MSYEPLHHKYRPQTFKDLVGQEAIADTLISAIESTKIAPAYLFTGPRGTGKTSSARILAKSLNCLAYDQPTSVPCGQCEVCKAIATGNALDVIEIDAASNTGVDNIREIIERSRFAPVQSRYKVYAIDECHMLSTAAFNALLKTLEEPPAQVVFILATTDPQRVLSTIISRCQRFDYRRIRLDAMVKHLSYIAQQENIAVTPEAITLISQIANGGLRDAESLLDQLSLFPQEITVEKIWDLIGAVPEKDLLALLIAIRKKDIENIVAQCRSLLDRGREPLVLLQNLAGFYLNLLIAKTAPNRQDLVAVTETCWQELCTEAQHWQHETILKDQQQLKEGEVQIKNTTQPRLWLEVTLLGLLSKTSVTQNAVAISDNTQQTAPTKEIQNSTATLTQSATPLDISQNSPNKQTQNHQKLDSAKTKDTINQNQDAFNKSFRHDVSSSQKVAQSSNTFPNKQEAVVDSKSSASELSDIASTEEQAVVWQQVIDCIHPPMTQALLRQQCHLISLTDSLAIVGISSAPLHKMNLGKVPNIETAFAKVCQRKIKVTLEVATKQSKSLAQNAKLRSQSTQTNNLSPDNTFAQNATNQQVKNTASSEKEPQNFVKEVTKAIAEEEPSQTIESKTVLITDSLDTVQDVSAIKNEPTFTANTSSNLNDFTKAVELVAQKFDGEIIELQNSSPTAIATTTEITQTTSQVISKTNSLETNSTTAKQQKVVIKREAIADYDDEDIPF